MAMTRFERKVAGYDRDEANRRREGRLADHMEGEQAQLDRQAAARMSARERRLAENAMIAKSDPGRFSSFERNALLGLQHTKAGDVPLVDRQERQGLQDFEMAKLKQQGANEAAVAEQKRFGMKEQGSDAAGIAAKTELEKAETEWGARKDIAETDAEAKRFSADRDLEGKKYGADRAADGSKAQHGYFDNEGVYHPGSNVAVAKQQGETAVSTETIRSQATVGAAAAQAEAQRLRDAEKNRAVLERATLGLDKKIAKDIETSAVGIMKAAAENGKTISFEDAIEQVKKQRGIVTDENGRNKVKTNWKEGQTQKLSSGNTAVFRDGKWQLAE